MCLGREIALPALGLAFWVARLTISKRLSAALLLLRRNRSQRPISRPLNAQARTKSTDYI
jgi:hypothetical protein